MPSPLDQLIPAIVAYVEAHEGYVTKTKLLKLLYLIDLEYYRTNRETLTSFHWRYLHLGPWAAEFDPLLDSLRNTDKIRERQSSRLEHDTKFLGAYDTVDLRRLFKSYVEESIVKSVLDTWGEKTTAEILDHVYFHTEPMECGVRSEPLDFSIVPPGPPTLYKRSSSGKSSSEIAALRKSFEAKKLKDSTTSFEFRPPNYDEEFRIGLEKLESGDV